jgi:hypothetical protein
MKILSHLILSAALFSFVPYIASADVVKLLGTSSYDEGKGIAIDVNGNCYITGNTMGDFDGNINAGDGDVFIIKYDTNLQKMWTRILGSLNADVGRAIAVDSYGNSYITGVTRGNLDGNVNAGDWDIFIVKYDTNGNKQWTKLLGTSGPEIANGIAVDQKGNCYIIGYTTGSLDGNIKLDFSNNIVIAKYDTNGNKQWTIQLVSSVVSEGTGISVDLYGNIYITGDSWGNLDLNINSGEFDIVIAKYDTNGYKQWTRLLGSSSRDNGSGIAIDSSGNCYITGVTEGDIDGNINSGGFDVVIAKYDTNGNKKWTKVIGSSNHDVATGIAVDSNDYCYITGYTQGSLDGNINSGGYDIFAAKYDANGNKQWAKVIGTLGGDLGHAIAVDSKNNIYITGYTDGNLGGQVNAGDNDIFIWKFKNNYETVIMPILQLLID